MQFCDLVQFGVAQRKLQLEVRDLAWHVPTLRPRSPHFGFPVENRCVMTRDRFETVHGVLQPMRGDGILQLNLCVRVKG